MSTSEPGAELVGRLHDASIDRAAICRFLDALSHAQRVEATRALGRAEQRRLYAAVDGFRSVELVDLVPASVGEMRQVRHFGRNTLPAFTLFEKRFCRPKGVDPRKPDALYGYNFQSLSLLTGPGYFVARPVPGRPEVDIDYRELPPEHPAGWPEVRSNERGLGRFVYGFMVDTLRRVSEHVTIGSAAKGGKPIGSWFVLVREEPIGA
jgi:hypothetical protein